MINIHVGVPGVLELISGAFWASNRPATATSSFPISSRVFAETVRPYLIGRRKDQEDVGYLRRRADETISRWIANDFVAVSDPLLLGGANDFLKSGPCFPNAERIASRMEDLLNGCDLRIHLVITNKLDAIWLQPHLPIPQRLHAVRNCDFSWANLVWRLRRGCPSARIVVWDAEQPDLLADHLSKELGAEQQGGVAEALGSNSLRDRANDQVLSKYFLEEDYDRVFSIDQSYDEDLSKISRLSRVTLYSG
jgi:hypothetical protein